MRTENDFSFKGEIVKLAATDGAMLYAMLCRPTEKSEIPQSRHNKPAQPFQGAFYRGFLSARPARSLSIAVSRSCRYHRGAARASTSTPTRAEWD